MEPAISLPTLDQLRDHVHRVLCEHDQLDPGQTPLDLEVIVRSGRPCGLLFRARGPRLVRPHAVWAGEEGRVLFYDSRGQRFAQIRLSEAPDPLQLA
jgi:hypothetical protein